VLPVSVSCLFLPWVFLPCGLDWVYIFHLLSARLAALDSLWDTVEVHLRSSHRFLLHLYLILHVWTPYLGYLDVISCPSNSPPAIYCHLTKFCSSQSVHSQLVLWLLLTSHSSLLLQISHSVSICLWDLPRVRTITLPSYICRIHTVWFEQYWTSSCLADSFVPLLPYAISYSSDWGFASGFLQIPPHDGYLCLLLKVPNTK
jgi:hypothetical protein